jgi:hypothetical protein
LTLSSGVIRRLIETRCPTRLPQRAQNTSTPWMYSAPHWVQLAARPSEATLAPQWPQKGSVGSTFFAQRGQCLSRAYSPPVATGPVGADVGSVAAAAAIIAGAARPAWADSGFPQSMQNREAGSFAAPQ